jgi:peptidoglycan/LPS O-acetylase OafA/YrhL
LKPGPASAAGSGQPTLAGIELLRFVCACAVLLWHYQHFSYIAHQAHDFDPTRQPFYAALSFLYRYGLYGVQVFWCISGFIFFWKYGAAIAARRIGPGRFFLLRWSRLYPLHLATLLLVALLQALYFAGHQYYFVYRDNSLSSFALQLGLASHWLYPLTGFSFNGPIWSVSLEVLAYLCFFALARFAGAGARVTLAALLAAGLAWRYCDWPLLECLLYFYLGGALALGYQAVAGWPPAARRGLHGALAALLALVCAASWLRPVPGTTVLLLATPLVIWLLLHAVRPRGAGVSRWLGGLGNLTYGSYLLHFPLQIGVGLLCGALGVTVPWYSRAFWLGFMAAVLLLAWASHRYFELPMQQALRRRLGAVAVSPAPVSAALPDRR